MIMPSNEEQGSSILIAIDKDSNSKHAVRWAVDHLLDKNSSCTLIHVRTKSLSSSEFDVPKHGRAPTEEELHQLFLPFRGFCARKGIIAEELVLHDIDVSSALTDYIIDHPFINVVVVGAPRWSNAIIRRFKDLDVPSSLIKSLPETCTVHIISKGKVHSVQATAPSITISSPQPNYLSKEINRTSWRRYSNDGGYFGQNKDARLSRKCKSQREFCPSRRTLSDESQDAFIYKSKSTKVSPTSMETRTTKKSQSATVSRELGLAKPKDHVEWIREVRHVEEAVLDSEKAELKIEKGKHEEVITLNVIEQNKYIFKRYNIEEIEVATNYFDIDGKIGEGGYGPVFKGVLDNRVVAIITGKPPIGVAHLVEEAIKNNNFAEVLDPNVTDWPVEEVVPYAKIALKCCEMRKKDRPDLATVILPELIRLRDL
ncbi:hypothetical protein TSUD_111330 [Trifolium subterraneum]|uniref:RING-type E3 ubiquitin transferase n=1 Tax=Trifolium subterraneum TaxID=3900 RepID=A0A2Z6LXB6_TRISU|nr:hypothetical protein TSUD_111330 [Trifolium subterraneum]